MKPQSKRVESMLIKANRKGLTGFDFTHAHPNIVDYRIRISEIRAEKGWNYVLDSREKHEGGTHKRYYIGGSK